VTTLDTTEAEYDDHDGTAPITAPSYFTDKTAGRHCGDPTPCTGRNGCRCGASVAEAT
jgi:hypothetical protein